MGRIFLATTMLAGFAAEAHAAPVTLRLLTSGGQTERVSAEIATVSVLGFDADEVRACVRLNPSGRTTWAVREIWMRPVQTAPAAPKTEAGTVAGPGNGMGGLSGGGKTLQNCP